MNGTAPASDKTCQRGGKAWVNCEFVSRKSGTLNFAPLVNKGSWQGCHMPIIPTLSEAEAGESLEFEASLDHIVRLY